MAKLNLRPYLRPTHHLRRSAPLFTYAHDVERSLLLDEEQMVMVNAEGARKYLLTPQPL
jgi:hypothetical protein